MAESLKNKLDQAFFERFCQLPVFPFHKLTRPDADSLKKQKQAFLRSGAMPVFSYSLASAFDTKAYFNQLKACERDLRLTPGEAWVRDLYLGKLDGLKQRAEIVRAIQQGDDQQVAELYQKLLGQTGASETALESELQELIVSSQALHEHTKPITAEKFVAATQELLDHYGMGSWRIKLSEGSSIRISRGRKAKHPTIHIPKNYQASRARARRALIHEIEVHALRTHNGMQSPLHMLQIGLDGYMITEEGLALFYQRKQGKKEKQFDPAFWESYACALSQMHDFAQTFEILLHARQQLDVAMDRETTEATQKTRVWNLCVRTYRGITHPNGPGLGTCRDSMYRAGLEQIRSLDMQDASVQKTLFAGNIGLEHIGIIKNLDLSYVQTPEFISEKMFRKTQPVDRG